MGLSADTIGLGLATGLATILGGVMALRLQAQAELIQGFSKGAVIGVALLELLPEALKTAGSGGAQALILACCVTGFAGSLALDRALSAVLGDDSGHRGHAGAGGLTAHSLMDGMAIGLAFQASPAIGAVVAAAVIAHDLSDGVNTVNLSLMGGSSRKAAGLWLVADAIAPTAGIALSGAVTLAPAALALLLAALAGVLAYIGTGKLKLTLGRDGRPAAGQLAMAAGFGFIFGVSRLLST